MKKIYQEPKAESGRNEILVHKDIYSVYEDTTDTFIIVLLQDTVHTSLLTQASPLSNKAHSGLYCLYHGYKCPFELIAEERKRKDCKHCQTNKHS